ncbi:response regulator [Ahrensia sp. 13_GOM-1096m]|uniref:response regulator n=1 Tax=Ahrensia sp. 13_GOM-1096m TaxID=1380380 RepID=UPI000AD57003|nr:response regulator [Ahrensia sp. 13_GOM-1096m]
MPKKSHFLIVEDDIFLAMDLEESLIEEGYHVIGVARSVEEAEQILQNQTPDYALLDYNLGDKTSVPIARKLANLGVKFAYVTGQLARFLEDDKVPTAPIFSKPIDLPHVLRSFA